jgi:ATP phosphoribosyltransferase regulatory subunit
VVQESLLAEMRAWGYRQAVTPLLENLETLALGLGAEELRRLFKVVDADGRVLGLVGERTVPIARLAAGALRATELPLRLCYAGAVLTLEANAVAGRRETYQIGAELIGASGPAADAEVIALAVRCLQQAGLGRFQVDVGHSEFFLGVLEGLEAAAEVKAGIRAALAARDVVGVERLLETTSLRAAERDLLLRFPALRGGAELLGAARRLVSNHRSARALDQLAEVIDLLEAHGLGAAVTIDLGLIRDFDYYTGVIFEGFGEDLGRPLAQGGRYDRLLGRFGRPAPATGFVVPLDLVADALGRRRPPSLPLLDAAVAWRRGSVRDALRLGASLRLFGMRAVVDTEPRSLAAARRWRAAVGARHLVHFGAANPAWLPPAGRLRRLPVEQVVAKVAEASAR